MLAQGGDLSLDNFLSGLLSLGLMWSDFLNKHYGRGLETICGEGIFGEIRVAKRIRQSQTGSALFF
jgi:hypothetical protein